MSNANETWGAEPPWKEVLKQLGEGSIIGQFIVEKILAKLAEVLYGESNVLSLWSPIVICGDIHGQYEDLDLLFQTAEGMGGKRFLFMGDYVDRGKWSLNTFLRLAIRKLMDPDQIFLLRGNHESRTVSQHYGFYLEIKLNYTSPALWTEFMRIFDLLPVAAIIDKHVFSIHGGLSPQITLVEQANLLKRKIEIPQDGPLADFTWSDPEETLSMDWLPNKRGAGFLFRKEPTDKFCHINRLSFITRSHQLVQDGYMWMFRDHVADRKGLVYQGRLINVWSAPNYGGTSGNRASFMLFGLPGQLVKLKHFDPRPSRIPVNECAWEYFA
jgi:diadenosine tetraphosphatase ApaH/serine/threonine PP2A family protein phosphatase